MIYYQLALVAGLIIIRTTVGVLRDFSICHDEFSLKPADGVLKENTFTWLAFVQYVHLTTGLPHHSRAPRVVLIHKQFVLGAATDLLRLPNNYKLGNIVFGDYDRDEEDCGMTASQIKMGETCPRAYLEMPLTDIIPHPEYSRFGVGNSLALIKLLSALKSEYTIPVCLPSLTERTRKSKHKVVFMVDYISTVPRDFDTERLGKKTMRMYTHKECRKHRRKASLGSEGITHVLCSSGCGVRPGAPIVSHNLEGQFELIGIAVGGAPCSRRSMRRRLNPEPPVYIDVYPYKGWIINVITAHAMPKPYPSNFRLVDGKSDLPPSLELATPIKKEKDANLVWLSVIEGETRVSSTVTENILTVFYKGVGYHLRARKRQQSGWRARTYVSGDFCYRSEKRQKILSSIFYSEKFEVNADPPAMTNVYMKISAGIETTILCARLTMPNRLSVPRIRGVGGYNISVTFRTNWFPYAFFFSLALSGTNSTEKDKYSWAHERSEGFW